MTKIFATAAVAGVVAVVAVVGLLLLPVPTPLTLPPCLLLHFFPEYFKAIPGTVLFHPTYPSLFHPHTLHFAAQKYEQFLNVTQCHY